MLIPKWLSFFLLCGCFLGSTMSYGEEGVASISHQPTFEAVKPGDTFLCIGRSSTGLDWENGEWRTKTFKPTKWLVRKERAGTGLCNLSGEKDRHYSSADLETWNLRRCYSYKEFGSQTELGGLLNTNVCFESYSSNRPNGPQVQCSEHIFHEIAFVPNGEYLIQTGGVNIPPSSKGVYDSKFIETGSCSSM